MPFAPLPPSHSSSSPRVYIAKPIRQLRTTDGNSGGKGECLMRGQSVGTANCTLTAYKLHPPLHPHPRAYIYLCTFALSPRDTNITGMFHYNAVSRWAWKKVGSEANDEGPGLMPSIASALSEGYISGEKDVS